MMCSSQAAFVRACRSVAKFALLSGGVCRRPGNIFTALNMAPLGCHASIANSKWINSVFGACSAEYEVNVLFVSCQASGVLGVPVFSHRVQEPNTATSRSLVLKQELPHVGQLPLTKALRCDQVREAENRNCTICEEEPQRTHAEVVHCVRRTRMQAELCIRCNAFPRRFAPPPFFIPTIVLSDKLLLSFLSCVSRSMSAFDFEETTAYGFLKAATKNMVQRCSCLDPVDEVRIWNTETADKYANAFLWWQRFRKGLILVSNPMYQHAQTPTKTLFPSLESLQKQAHWQHAPKVNPNAASNATTNTFQR